MAASLTAPKVLNVGPSFVGSNTSVEKCVHVLVGVTGSTPAPDVLVDAQATYQVLSIPAGVLVTAVQARIITAFTATLTMTIGDTNAAAGWLSTAKLAPTVADAVGIWKAAWVGTQDAYAAGRKYLTADTIQVVIATATPAVGLLELAVFYVDGPAGTA
jgi:hypothetical protein